MSTTGFDAIAPRLDYAMLVVTVAAGDERAGCLVGFHTQCSIDPVRYALWISRHNQTLRVALDAKVFALHFLDGAGGAGHQLAELFGGTTGDTHDKFADCAWHSGDGGVPILDGCAHRLLGVPIAVHDDPSCDHVCFVLDIVDADSDGSLTPLMFSQVRDIEAAGDESS